MLTAVGNDYGYDRVFERQVRGLGRAGDVLIAHFDLGQLAQRALGAAAARALGIVTIGFTGTAPGAAAMRAVSDVLLAAPTDDTPLIQQIHITAGHAICEIVERNLFKP